MGRPTSDKKDGTIILRLNAEEKGKIAREAKAEGISISEYLRGMISSGRGFKYDYLVQELDEIAGMAYFWKIDSEDLLRGIYVGLTEGTLGYQEGRVVGCSSIDMEGFLERCHELNIDPQEAIDKYTKELK